MSFKKYIALAAALTGCAAETTTEDQLAMTDEALTSTVTTFQSEQSGMGHLIGRKLTKTDSLTGQSVTGWSANVAQDNAGYLQFGPYQTGMARGLYTISYYAMVDNNTANNDVVATVDIYESFTNDPEEHWALASRELRRKDFKSAYGLTKFDIPLNVQDSDPTMRLEYRVYWTDKSWLLTDRVEVRSNPNSPATISYPVTSAVVQTGHIVGDVVRADTHTDNAGYMLRQSFDVPGITAWHENVSGGRHTADFQLRVDNNTANNDLVAVLTAVFKVDPNFGNYGTSDTSEHVMATRNIYRKDFTAANTFQHFTLNFGDYTGGTLELRVKWLKKSWMEAKGVVVSGTGATGNVASAGIKANPAAASNGCVQSTNESDPAEYYARYYQGCLDGNSYYIYCSPTDLCSCYINNLFSRTVQANGTNDLTSCW